MGEVIGSIGEDGRCKLWQEDVTEVLMSGNRFKLITNLASQTHAPFMSLDFKNIMQETWLALITRDGLLTVYEPQDQSSLNEWTVIAERWVSEDNPPERQEEVGFKVVFHKEKLPCWTAIMAGLDRKSLSLAVAAMKDVLIFRTDKAKRFFQVAKLEGARQIIRDLAWANGSMRGYDILATASKDGAIRIYELSTPTASKSSAGPTSTSTALQEPASPRPAPRQAMPSGIGAGLAGTSRAQETPHDNDPGRISQLAKLTDELTNHHGAVWRVTFSHMGKSVLMLYSNNILTEVQAISWCPRAMTVLFARGRRLLMVAGQSMQRSTQHARIDNHVHDQGLRRIGVLDIMRTGAVCFERLRHTNAYGFYLASKLLCP
jgi:nucleoporin SEH1